MIKFTNKEKNNITFRKQHFAQTPFVAISAAMRLGIESNRFDSVHEEDHSRLLSSEPNVHLYELQEGITSKIPTNKIPNMFKTGHIR